MPTATANRAFLIPDPVFFSLFTSSLFTSLHRSLPLCSKSRSAQIPPKFVCNRMNTSDLIVLFFAIECDISHFSAREGGQRGTLCIQQCRKVRVQHAPRRISAVHRIGKLLPSVPECLLHLRLSHITFALPFEASLRDALGRPLSKMPDKRLARRAMLPRYFRGRYRRDAAHVR